MADSRRLHLVVAFALVGAALARAVLDVIDIAPISPLAARGCLWASLALEGLVVWRVSRSRDGLLTRAVAWSAIAGLVIGLLSFILLGVDRPDADLSFAGINVGGPIGPMLLGGFAGMLVGIVVGAFARVARSLNQRAPELTCVAAWGLAAIASLTARNFLGLIPCALGAAIQLAKLRRPREQTMIVRPYR